MSYVVTFRGHPACPCLAEWLPVYEAELLRRGIVKHNIDIYQLIGGAAASAGTHTKGGAYDVAQVTTEAIEVAREMGAAAWHRPKNWDNAGGIEHHHGVLNGCPHNTPARYQIDAYKLGFNGLGRLGHGAADNGPRVMPLRTWKAGITWAKNQAKAAKPKRPENVRDALHSINDQAQHAGPKQKKRLEAAKKSLKKINKRK